MYSETVREMLDAWDKGDTIWTIEMGGLGPGYEQAIQVLMVEICRAANEQPRRESEPEKEYSDRFMGIRDEVAHKIDDACGGFSGAQVGAAANVAYRFVCDGPKAAIEKFKEQCPGDSDRLIQVSNYWPKVESAA